MIVINKYYWFSREPLPPEVKFQATRSQHRKSRVSILTLIWKMVLRLGLKNLKPAGQLGRAWLFFWKAAFPQSGPAVSEKTWVSPAVPKAGRTGRLGTLLSFARSDHTASICSLSPFPSCMGRWFSHLGGSSFSPYCRAGRFIFYFHTACQRENILCLMLGALLCVLYQVRVLP